MARFRLEVKITTGTLRWRVSHPTIKVLHILRPNVSIGYKNDNFTRYIYTYIRYIYKIFLVGLPERTHVFEVIVCSGERNTSCSSS